MSWVEAHRACREVVEEISPSFSNFLFCIFYSEFKIGACGLSFTLFNRERFVIQNEENTALSTTSFVPRPSQRRTPQRHASPPPPPRVHRHAMFTSRL
jgi:hypothetical protein